MPSFESCVKKNRDNLKLVFSKRIGIERNFGNPKKIKKIDKSGLVVEIFQSINECKQHGYTNVY